MKKIKKAQIGYICSMSFLIICSAVFLGLFIFSSANLGRYEQQALFATQTLAEINNESEQQIKDELALFLISNDNKNRLERLSVIEALSHNLSTKYLYDYIQVIKPKISGEGLSKEETDELKKFIEDPNREFSATPETIEYKGLKTEDVSEIDARTFVTNLFKQSNGIAYTDFNTQRGSYNYKVLLPNDSYYLAEVSKKGKMLLTLTYSGDKKSGTLTEQECRQSVNKFMDGLGFSLTLADTVKTQYGYKFTYVPVVQNVKIYSRKVEIEISSWLGELLSFDSCNYAKYENPTNFSVNLTPQQAQNKLNKNLEVKDCQLAVILNGTGHVLVYRFKVKLLDEEHILYINAKTGEEYIM